MSKVLEVIYHLHNMEEALNKLLDLHKQLYDSYNFLESNEVWEVIKRVVYGIDNSELVEKILKPSAHDRKQVESNLLQELKEIMRNSGVLNRLELHKAIFDLISKYSSDKQV